MRLRLADFDRLARDGGTPVRSTPFAPWPVFDDEMQSAVSDVLKSGRVNYWTGEECRQFEREFSASVGCEYGVAVANGTVALELALFAANIGSGDDVIVPPRTFIATASAAVMRGARPVFADIDPVSGNITAATIEAALTPRTRAIIVVHTSGWPCEMGAIMELANARNLIVIEDCAQAHGATLRGEPIGSLGHLAAFSFCQDKIMTTGGEGGLVTTSSQALWERAWSFKDHGKNWDAVYHRQHPTIFKWVHESFGTNWRMTELQAAIGRVALRRLPEWVATRRRNAGVLNDLLADVDGLEVPMPDSSCEHSYYKFYVNLARDASGGVFHRDEVVRCLQAEGIPCGSGLCCEIYREAAFLNSGYAPEPPLPAAAELADRSIMLLVHPTLNEDDMRDAASGLEKVMQAAANGAMVAPAVARAA